MAKLHIGYGRFPVKLPLRMVFCLAYVRPSVSRAIPPRSGLRLLLPHLLRLHDHIQYLRLEHHTS